MKKEETATDLHRKFYKKNWSKKQMTESEIF